MRLRQVRHLVSAQNSLHYTRAHPLCVCRQPSLSGNALPYGACDGGGLSGFGCYLPCDLCDAAPPQYEKLLAYIHAQGLEIAGFSREITLIDYGLTNDPAKFVTEISIPVE